MQALIASADRIKIAIDEKLSRNTQELQQAHGNISLLEGRLSEKDQEFRSIRGNLESVCEELERVKTESEGKSRDIGALEDLARGLNGKIEVLSRENIPIIADLERAHKELAIKRTAG
jgi:chromosome segregation ATPase